MRNQDTWKPSKFIKDGKTGKYVPNPSYVGVGSRFMCSVFIEDYIRLIKEHCSGILLDCGCGDVPYYEMYKDNVSNIVCIDWENTLHKNDFVDQYVDLNKEIPMESSLFDTILVADVLEHIASPDVFMKEMTRLLKPAGKLVIMVPFYYWIHEEPHDYARYTEFALRNFCITNNLTIIYLKPYGGFPDILLDLINKRFVKKEKSVGIFMKICTMLKRTTWYQKSRSTTVKHFPLGYCMVAKK